MSNRTLVHETANAPGTNVTFNLGGFVDGRRSFAMAFPSGAAVLYVITDGVQSEWGMGVFTAGAPNTLSRTTVYGNTANTTSRLNFTAAVDVYNALPAELQIYAGSDWGGAAGGTANALSCTVPMPLVAQIPGMALRLIASASNTGNATLNVNGLGAQPLRRANGTEIPAGMLVAGAMIEVVAASATEWRLAPEPLAGLLTSGPLAGLRNLIINGNPVINQRNVVSGATMLGNGLDRWRTTVSGAVSWTDSGGVRTVTAPAGGMYQIIEDLSVAGGVYTLSYQGTATAKVNGVTVANGGQYTLAAGADASLEFLGGTWAKAQLEPGTLATPFEPRPAALELMLCRRYFRPLGFDLPMRFNALGNMSTHAPIQFDPPMRGTPTVTPAWTAANGNATGFVVNRLSRFGAIAELSSVASGDTYVTLQAATSFSAEL